MSIERALDVAISRLRSTNSSIPMCEIADEAIAVLDDLRRGLRNAADTEQIEPEHAALAE